jgi:hypothetical protein
MYLKQNKMQDTYAIIDINDLLKVDFRQVGQTSAETVRKSLDGSMFVLKWEETPTFITDGLIVPLQLLTHEECLELMNTSKWSETIE